MRHLPSTLRSLRSAGPLSLIVALAAGALAPAPARAGIVVLKNGEVMVGRIRPTEDTQEELIVRWPYRDHTERGEFHIEKFRIRWYSIEADEPTDAYWEQFHEADIDNAYHHLRERWRLRREAQNELNPGIELLIGGGTQSRLSPIPVQTRYFDIGKPDGWSSQTEEGVTIFISNEPGTDGFKPRIHVFSVPTMPRTSPDDQLRLIQETIDDFAPEGFRIREQGRLRPLSSGFDQDLLTESRRSGRTVLALRRVSFRRERTYFFTAYVHERDHSTLAILLDASMRSMAIREDAQASSTAPVATPPGPPPPGR